MSCLLGTRLVESGVRFVTLTLGGWDTHTDNWTRLKTRLLPDLDTGLSALLNGLAEKGLLDTTTVFVTGEFGRTPKINTRDAEGGRDHYPRCMFMLHGRRRRQRRPGARRKRRDGHRRRRTKASRPTTWPRRSTTRSASTTPRNTTPTPAGRSRSSATASVIQKLFS